MEITLDVYEIISAVIFFTASGMLIVSFITAFDIFASQDKENRS